MISLRVSLLVNTVCPVLFLEKLVGSQIAAGFQSRMYENSTAYRKHHSGETTLITLVEAWKKARDESLVVNIPSTDISKVFDSLHPPPPLPPITVE